MAVIDLRHQSMLVEELEGEAQEPSQKFMETSKSVLKRLVEVERQVHGDWENDEDMERKVGMAVFSSETVELGVELQKMDHASKKARVFGEYLERTFLTEEKKEKRSSIERKGLNLNEVTECVKEVQTRLKKSFLYEVNFFEQDTVNEDSNRNLS